jgi:hypothetical protein
MPCYSQLCRKAERLGARKPAASPQNVGPVEKGPAAEAGAPIEAASPAAGASPGASPRALPGWTAPPGRVLAKARRTPRGAGTLGKNEPKAPHPARSRADQVQEARIDPESPVAGTWPGAFPATPALEAPLHGGAQSAGRRFELAFAAIWVVAFGGMALNAITQAW